MDRLETVTQHGGTGIDASASLSGVPVAGDEARPPLRRARVRAGPREREHAVATERRRDARPQYGTRRTFVPWRSSIVPLTTPSRAAAGTTISQASAPGASIDEGGVSVARPVEEDARVGHPPGAHAVAGVRELDPRVAVARVNRPNERLVGSANRSSRSALARDTSPPPWSCAARERGRARRPAPCPSARAPTSPGRPSRPGWRCGGGSPGDVRQGHARARGGRPAARHRRRGRRHRGLETSGFSRSEIAVGPTEEKSARTIVDGVAHRPRL